MLFLRSRACVRRDKAPALNAKKTGKTLIKFDKNKVNK